MQTPLDQASRSQEGFPLPVDLGRYNHEPTLSPGEQKALATFAAHPPGKHRQLSQPMRRKLSRLVEPLDEVLHLLDTRMHRATSPLPLLLCAMHERGTSYWAWSEEEWITLIQSLHHSRQGYAQRVNVQLRYQLLVIAYCLGPQTDFFLPLLSKLSSFSLACYLFGKEPLEAAVERVCGLLQTWGYEVEVPTQRRHLMTAIAELLLATRSPHLEDVTLEVLSQLRTHMVRYKRICLGRLSKALAHLGIIGRPLPSANELQRVPPEQLETDGIAASWVEWCLQWYHFSSLTPVVKRARLTRLLRVGRWLAVTHPDITEPAQWTGRVADEYVAALEEMKVGDFCSSDGLQKKEQAGIAGKPLSAGSKECLLTAIRAFFRDLQDEPHNLPRRFDPARAFRTPRAIRNQIGPNPRDLNPLLWAKIVHAALNLTEEDLAHSWNGAAFYPLPLARAVAAVWVYSGLRNDEIVRLSTGCIRWQHEDVTIPETGEVLPKEVTCFLTVPVNKTTGTFQKPVNPMVGKRINEWEQARASGQPEESDRKTGAMVNYLFSHRGHRVGKKYLNDALIPAICAKAGVPCEDERGTITSHRARATIATLLYNAPEGLSIFELMQWLGHTSPKSTQSYARVKPTKLAAAYAKAERNSRLVEVLVDTKADANGTVNVYYVLGDHGLCGNPDWASCLYRMACIKCPFFVPRGQAQLLIACQTVKRFMERVELTDEELAAVQDDYDKLQAAVQRTQQLVSPTEVRRRAKGAKSRGIPLTVLTSAPGGDTEVIS